MPERGRQWRLRYGLQPNDVGSREGAVQFQGGSDGAGPTSGLIEVDGILYGTTMQGGSRQCYTYGCGTV